MKTLNLLRTLGTQAATSLKSWAPTRRRRRPAVSEEPVEAMGLETLEGRVLMSTTMFMVDADTTTRTAIVETTDTTQDGDRTMQIADSGPTIDENANRFYITDTTDESSAIVILQLITPTGKY